MREALPEKADITIIGGGMVGAALAAILSHAHKDWDIVLVEAFPLPSEGESSFQPSFDDRSTALAQGSIELLQELGIWQTMQLQATPISKVHVSDKGHFGGSVIDAQELGLRSVGSVVPNAWIGQVLLQYLRNCPKVTLLAPAKVDRIQPMSGAANVHLQGVPVSMTSELVIIADGADSPLREKLGIDVNVEPYYQTAIIANVALAQPHEGIAYERFTDAGPMALLPLGNSVKGKQSALVWTQPEEQADALMSLPEEGFLELLQQRFGFRLGHFVGVGKRDAYPLQLKVAKEQVRSNIVVMGNAAHFLHPVAGQGFNLALRDCAALADILLKAIDAQESLGSLSVLQRYENQQRFDQQATIQFSDKLTRLFTSSGLPLAALRGLGFVGLEALPVAKGLLANQTMGYGSRRPLLSR